MDMSSLMNTYYISRMIRIGLRSPLEDYAQYGTIVHALSRHDFPPDEYDAVGILHRWHYVVNRQDIRWKRRGFCCYFHVDLSDLWILDTYCCSALYLGSGYTLEYATERAQRAEYDVVRFIRCLVEDGHAGVHWE